MVAQRERPRTKTEFVRLLTEAGLSDFLVLEKETADQVLTARRVELLEYLRNNEVASVTALADALGRDKAAVRRDLDLLWEHSLVDYERDGKRKIPSVWHETVLVEPIL